MNPLRESGGQSFDAISEAKPVEASKKSSKSKGKTKLRSKGSDASDPVKAASSSKGSGKASSSKSPTVTHICAHSHSETDTTLDKESVRFYQETLENMRRHVPEMQAEKVDMYDVQTFVTSLYHSQMSAIAMMAEKNLTEKGVVSPVGDNWCILGLGSLGRGDVNPYSDLDFAILAKKDNEETREYFKALVSEMAKITHDFHDEGMHVCKGHVAPLYEGDDGRGGKKNMGSTELFGTPRTLARTVMERMIDPERAGMTMQTYSLMQVAFVHGKREYADAFMRTQKRGIGKELTNDQAKDHFSDVDTRNSHEDKKSEYTKGQAIGRRLLIQGLDFWRETPEVNNLRHGPDMATKLPAMQPPRVDIKTSVLRPIQNSAQGLAVYHGIYEPNPIKAIDRLVEKGVIDKALGEEVKDLYKATCGIRVRLELETKEEKTLVTRCPDHILCKLSAAQTISDAEYELLSGAVKTLDKLKAVTNEYLKY